MKLPTCIQSYEEMLILVSQNLPMIYDVSRARASQRPSSV